MKNKYLIFLFALSTACVSGPKDPEQTTAAKLNGENYTKQDIIMGVPVLERKPVSRNIYGQIFCGEGIERRRFSGAKIILLEGETVVAETMSASDGRYEIIQKVKIGTDYKLTVTSSCGSGSQKISFKEKPDARGLDFSLKK